MGAMISEDRFGVLTLKLNVAQIAAGTSAEQTFTVFGLRPNDYVGLSKPTLHAGVGVANVRVSAKDTLAVQFFNTTAGAVTPGLETYLLFYFRPEHVNTSVNT